MNWLIFFEILYIILVVMVSLRIIYDTRTTTKTLAYLLLAIFVPFGGMIFYFLFGVNYRKNKMYSKKLFANERLSNQITEQIYRYSNYVIEERAASVGENKQLANMLVKHTQSPLTANNEVKLLINGEEKFPEVIKALKEARQHIHLEYYIYEDDEIGRQIERILIDKVKEGVIVRFMYDDFGSHSIRKNLAKRLIENGVKVFPFLKINFVLFANRINYRNHRKIIIVDGKTAFVGGINVSDRYINHSNSNKQFWRDTHLRIDGMGVHYLQYLFLCDWNFCSNEKLQPNEQFFPGESSMAGFGDKVVQIVASGPDSETPNILFSVLKAINLASDEILITSPYFIPGESLTDALVIASLSGVSVKLLVPGVSDSVLVNAAAKSYYSELLKAGVEIFLYNKGFVHSKTMVTDGKIAMVGTANMDYRSFDLNFEVNAIVYDEEIAKQLRMIFFEDLRHAEKIDPGEWNSRSGFRQLLEKTARLISPMI